MSVNRSISGYIFVVVCVCIVIAAGVLVWTNNRPEPQSADVLPQEKETPIVETETDPLPKPFSLPRRKNVSRAIDSTTSHTMEVDTSLDQLEKKLGHLSLSELIPILEKMDKAVVRDLGENAEWFSDLLDTETVLLSDEEYIALETLERKVYDGKIEEDYEKHFGYPMPPPGYVMNRSNGGANELIRINKPYVRVKQTENAGYGQWDNLTQDEFTRYLILEAIANKSELLESWNLDVSDAVAERAKTMKQPLYEKSWGTHAGHAVSVVGYWTRPKTDADIALEDQLKTEAHADLDLETRESTRQSSNHSYATHRDDYASVIREIEAHIKH